MMTLLGPHYPDTAVECEYIGEKTPISTHTHTHTETAFTTNEHELVLCYRWLATTCYAFLAPLVK